MKGTTGSYIVDYIKRIQQLNIPILVIDAYREPERTGYISYEYAKLKEKLATLKDPLKIEYQKELIFEFEDEYVERKARPRFWLANEQLKVVYRHLAAIKNHFQAEADKQQCDKLMAKAKKIDKKLRHYKADRYALDADLSQVEDLGIVFAIDYQKKGLALFQKGMAIKGPVIRIRGG